MDHSHDVLSDALAKGECNMDLLKSVPTKEIMYITTMLKEAADSDFQENRYEAAIDKYTQVIVAAHHLEEVDTLKKVYSNRSLAHTCQKDYDKALKDADQCIALDPTWEKGYYRKGCALLLSNKPMDAKPLFVNILKSNPKNSHAKAQLNKCEMALNVLRNAVGQNTVDVEHAAVELKFDTSFSTDYHPNQKWFKESKVAKSLQKLLFDYSELMEIHKCADTCMKFDRDVWLPVVEDKMIVCGTQLGRIPLLSDKKLICVERYPMIARLAEGVYRKNQMLRKKEYDTEFKCEPYERITSYPSSVLFTDWDYSVLGTGWLATKKALKSKTFYPEKIRVWIEFVHDPTDVLPNSWYSSVASFALDDCPSIIVGKRHYLDDIDTTGEFETYVPPDCLLDKPVHGIKYGYDIVMPHGVFNVCKECAFQKYDMGVCDAHLLKYKVLPTKLHFFTGAEAPDTSNVPMHMVQVIDDAYRNERYETALESLAQDPNASSKYQKSYEPSRHGALSCLVQKHLPECDVQHGEITTKETREADLVVFDLFDAGLIGNGLLHYVETFQKSKTLLPQGATMYAQVVECRNAIDRYGTDLTLTNPYKWMSDYQTTEGVDYIPLGEPFEITTMDFYKVDKSPQDYGKFSVSMTNDGVASAVVFWFELDLISTTMDSRQSNHRAALQYLPEHQVKRGETFDIQCKHDGSSFQFGSVSSNTNMLPTPRFDPQFVKKSTELETKMSEIMQRMKYHPWERKEVFATASKMASAAGRFQLNQSIADKFVKNCMFI